MIISMVKKMDKQEANQINQIKNLEYHVNCQAIIKKKPIEIANSTYTPQDDTPDSNDDIMN